ncbi:uncharacterized protein STAUR_4706 [Stigmatella aurantiaca DW4/3-1]|uniref:Uncharacterized protein n=1 Tax=Stigmatella aurantiaca (strain DW4/3-1) TaxID=378806 RepID=E3G093_STIAD|nr:uncharacterized protein STAUR_4706 [Stigmatella aurantiaca DW4/3-1]
MGERTSSSQPSHSSSSTCAWTLPFARPMRRTNVDGPGPGPCSHPPKASRIRGWSAPPSRCMRASAPTQMTHNGPSRARHQGHRGGTDGSDGGLSRSGAGLGDGSRLRPVVGRRGESHERHRVAGIGHRFGKVLGTNGMRVLVLLVTTVLSGKSAMASQGPRLPGFSQAALRGQAEAGFQLGAALNGGVSSIAMPAAGVLNVALALGAAAALAMYLDGRYPGDDSGPVHHICTNKNPSSRRPG